MKVYEGSEAWRNGFGREAADLLQLYRWAQCLSDDDFKKLLIACAIRSKGRTSQPVVERIINVHFHRCLGGLHAPTV